MRWLSFLGRGHSKEEVESARIRADLIKSYKFAIIQVFEDVKSTLNSPEFANENKVVSLNIISVVHNAIDANGGREAIFIVQLIHPQHVPMKGYVYEKEYRTLEILIRAGLNRKFLSIERGRKPIINDALFTNTRAFSIFIGGDTELLV